MGRSILPFPHNPHYAPEARKWEKTTVAQRLHSISSQLSATSMSILQGQIAAIAGSDNFEEVGYFDILRWWALAGYSTAGLYESSETFKIRKGQSFFARQFFEECQSTGCFSYAFQKEVVWVNDREDHIEVRTKDNACFTASHAISTLPLNVLGDIVFDPPLPEIKTNASKGGNIFQGAKVHFEVYGNDLRSWSAVAFPQERIFACLGDGLVDKKNTHIVAFGSNDASLSEQDDARAFIKSGKQLHPKFDVKHTVSGQILAHS